MKFTKDSVLSICLFLFTTYMLATFEEYFIHKYIMHQMIDLPVLKETAEEHIKHHKATNSDYTIKENDHSNICFSFTTNLLPIILILFITYFLFRKIISTWIILLTIFLFYIIHIISWNTLHSYVHYFEVNTICTDTFYGIPKEYINENNIYVKWSLENHRAHHYYKGEQKGNWNVVYPGADYIMGTHNILPPRF
jgi:hypothetical protein